MADLSTRFMGIQHPQSLLACLGAPDELRGADHARLRRGLGRRRVEDDRRAGGEHRLPLLLGGLGRPAHDGAEQHRADLRPARGGQPARDGGGEEALPEAYRDRLPDGGVQAGGLARHRQARGGRRSGRPGAELRLPARDERARHGRRGGPGARVLLHDHRVGQGGGAHAGDGEAHPQCHRHPRRCPRGQARRRGRPLCHQHHQLDHGHRPGHAHPAARRRRAFRARRLLRPRGEAHRAAPRAADRLRPRGRPSDLGHRGNRRVGAKRRSSC